MRVWPAVLLIAMSVSGVERVAGLELSGAPGMARAESSPHRSASPLQLAAGSRRKRAPARPHLEAPVAFDLSGDTVGRWMRDSQGLSIVVHHPDGPFPDGVLSRTGISRETIRHKKVRGRWIKRRQIEILAAPKVFRDDRTLLFIPEGLRFDRPIQLLIYFHGWRSTVTGSKPTPELQHLRESVRCAETNTVLIVPQGPYNYPTSRFGNLETIAGLTKFLQGLRPLLPGVAGVPSRGAWLDRVEHIILSGHSGGGQPITRLLEDSVTRELDVSDGGDADERWLWNRLDTIVLLDATYNGQRALQAWWEASPERVLKSYYLIGTGTEAVSLALSGLATTYPERRSQLEIEGTRWEQMPDEIKLEAHFSMPWYRLWKGMGSTSGSCRWAREPSVKEASSAPVTAPDDSPGETVAPNLDKPGPDLK